MTIVPQVLPPDRPQQSPRSPSLNDYFKNLDIDVEQSNRQNRNRSLRQSRTLTIKGVQADEDQRANMEVVITTARGVDGSGDRSILSAICAVIQESACRNLPQSKSDGTSSGILQVLASTGVSHNVDPRDIEGCVEEYMKNGWTGAGGAIKIAKENRNLSPGAIAVRVQGPADPSPGPFQQWEAEAEKWLEAAEGGRIEGGGGTYRRQYQYKREKDENSWEAMQRLAEEVNWRAFPLGRTFYYMSEPDLFRRRVLYTLTPEDESLIEFTYDIDWRAKRPVNEGIITVNLDRWGAPPGYPIQLEGFGPPDGRWLIISVRRDWFSPIAEVTIRQPIAPAKEPPSQRVERSSTGAEPDGSGMTLYRKCREISEKTTGYLYGGGHGPPLSSLNSKQKLDCSSSTSLALYRADMWDGQATARVSGDFSSWGRQGRGNIFTVCYKSTHVYIRFEPSAGVDAERFDTSSWGSGGEGPRLRFNEGPPNDDGYQLAHWPEL